MSLSDAEIVARVQRGDRKAFLDLFDRYYSRVERFAGRHLRNAEAARDIASETFLRAYGNIDYLRLGEMSYLGYLLRICRRLILAESTQRLIAAQRASERNQERRKTLVDRHELSAGRLQEKRPLDIRDALECLPMEDQEVLHLAFERDLSRRDIAFILDAPSVVAVSRHLYRALQGLKAMIDPQNDFAELYGTEK